MRHLCHRCHKSALAKSAGFELHRQALDSFDAAKHGMGLTHFAGPINIPATTLNGLP